MGAISIFLCLWLSLWNGFGVGNGVTGGFVVCSLCLNVVLFLLEICWPKSRTSIHFNLFSILQNSLQILGLYFLEKLLDIGGLVGDIGLGNSGADCRANVLFVGGVLGKFFSL